MIKHEIQLLRNAREISPPVAVAVICPPGAAITALINKMYSHQGTFTLNQSLPIQTSSLTKLNGQSDVQLFSLLIFSIARKEIETWLKRPYDEYAVYQMHDIMNDNITEAERN